MTRLLLSCLLLFTGPACAEAPPPPKPAASAPASAADPARAAADAFGWRFIATDRVIAIGDLHGDLEATRKALRLAGVIDADDRWTGGTTTVVQTGDQLDRGDDEKEIIDLLEALRPQAEAAGGQLIVLNGNHELMNVAGDLRYVTAGGFEDFKSYGPAVTDDPTLARLPEALRGRAVAFRPGGPYALILARRPLIAQVGDTLFAHGGVLPHHAKEGPGALNAAAAAWMRGEASLPASLRGEDSPHWSRHYSQDPDAADCRLLEETLAMLGVTRMVVGHTVHLEGPSPACDGKVWRVDVGLAAHYGGKPAVLEIKGATVRPLVGE